MERVKKLLKNELILLGGDFERKLARYRAMHERMIVAEEAGWPQKMVNRQADHVAITHRDLVAIKSQIRRIGNIYQEASK
jgi:hypothetical protein